ncbi:hypothetical protein [Siphonobacter sp. BAB-5385]|uniref:hypothetical protein n=1 Tax=Siphonobacter sp. BAB-5385 TaxID=1864822 RepID=UPI0020CCBCAA|nr:hypothetical protein [Siphonobacter sp. BAB-5385]
MKRLFILLSCISVYAHAQEQTPENLGSTVNSESAEIQPVIAPDGRTLYFSRVNHPQNASQKKGSQDVWMAEYLSGNSWTPSRRMPNPVNGEEHNVIYSITPDGNTILTHWVQKEGDDLSIRGFATMRKVATGWERPKKLDIPGLEGMNKGYYQYGFLANDGKTLLLAFSEKRTVGSPICTSVCRTKRGSGADPRVWDVKSIRTPMKRHLFWRRMAKPCISPVIAKAV